ncbi:MAG TPA: GNAT family N-acetyltransferase [Ignavibacteria bacterium]|nr:GNAT family N-acetyltransferase [Ignavibacteria bacterium]HRA99382.1 GNAT family N-acetyltransferase [Ignavibacteria bacterium]
MNITLRKINEDNWRECIALTVNDDQLTFVGSNVNGLALAYAHKEMNPLAIYNDETMVGFLMYAKDPDDGVYYINRLMIDRKFQGNGFGKQALSELLNLLRDLKVESVDILHKPDNHKAIKVYESLGFILTEDKVGDEVVSVLKL